MARKRKKAPLHPSVLAEMPNRMLRSAMAFYQAGQRCSDLGSPGVANHALSVEIYLKLLLFVTTGQTSNNHNLLELYGLLGLQVRRRIIANWSSANWPSFEDATSIRRKIKGVAEAFIQWRYSYEHQRLMNWEDDLPQIARAINVTLKEFAPPQLRVPKAPDDAIPW